MSGTESFVQLQPDSTGKAIDATAITSLVTGGVQYRQTTTLGDPVFAANVQEVTQGGDAQVRSFVLEDLLGQILIELRVQNTILQATLNSRDDLDLLRQQENLVTLQQTQ